jgi:hypothetical protein
MGRRWLIRWGISVAVAGALIGLSVSANAVETFPGVIVDTYGIKTGGLLCPPPCVICHTTPAGGLDTANMPFAINLQKITGGDHRDPALLPGFLETMEHDPCWNTEDPGCKAGADGNCTGVCDANGNGKGDIAELKTGRNPNNGNKLFCVTYGCGGARVAPKLEGRGVDGTFALAMLGVLVGLARRFRRA